MGVISQSGSTCVDDATCQAPRYYIHGEFAGTTYDNTKDPAIGGEDFGLDVFEPVFQLGKGDWEATREEGSGFEVHLTITDTDYMGDLFYFCHVHSKMSGRVVVVDSEGMEISSERTPELGYEYEVPSEFDESCGTYNIGDHTREGGLCLNGDALFCDDARTDFGECMYALDCHMQHYMRVDLNADPVAAFMHQMIPHHENAVNMAKLMLKTGVSDEADPEGEVHEMLYSIINAQNKQIGLMRTWLDDYGFESSTEAQCGDLADTSTYVTGEYSPACCSAARRRLLFGSLEDIACLCK